MKRKSSSSNNLQDLCFLTLLLEVNELKQHSLWEKGQNISFNKNWAVYASPLILQIYNLFATGSKCRENRHFSHGVSNYFWTLSSKNFGFALISTECKKLYNTIVTNKIREKNIWIQNPRYITILLILMTHTAPIWERNDCKSACTYTFIRHVDCLNPINEPRQGKKKAPIK